MRKHNEPEVNEKTRISIFTCSSGTAWKLIAGKHPFGKNGGTRGSVKTGVGGGEPRIPWVDGVVVGGSKRGCRDLVREALRIANIITTMNGPSFAWGLEATRKLHTLLKIENDKEFARAVELTVGEWGKEHAREHRREMSLYPSMPPTDYRTRERARKARCQAVVETGKVPTFWGNGGAKSEPVVQAEPVMIMEEVRIVPVAAVMSDGSIIPSLNSDDCIQ